MTGQVQETLAEAMVSPSVPRVHVHSGCGGRVLFRIEGGMCLRCDAGPLRVGEYEFAEKSKALAGDGAR